MKKITITLLSSLLAISSSFASNIQLSKEVVQGKYDLLNPQRGQTGQIQSLMLDYGKLGDKTILATAECERCFPATYSFLPEISKELDRPVFFNTQGVYVIAHDASTFVAFYPKPLVEIGKGLIEDFMYINVYNKSGTKGISLEQAKQLAKGEFKRLMDGDVKKVAVTGGSGEYHAIKPAFVDGKQHSTLKITIEDNKKIVVQGCIKGYSNCNTDNYLYNATASKDVGKAIYTRRNSNNSQRYIFEYQPGVLIRLYQTGGLGFSNWNEDVDIVNIFSQDKNVNRQISQDAPIANEIFTTIKTVAKKAKAAQDKRYEQEKNKRFKNNKLPTANKDFNNMRESFLVAAEARATRENWNETLIKAYAIGGDWAILRNKLTGVQTGRMISGVVAMERKDGNCSYQHVHFAQEFNGSSYQKPYLYSIDSGQRELDCSKVK